MKGLNLAGFSKVKEEKNAVHMKHKDGHVIVIATMALPKIQREQLKRLPFAEGGEVKGVHKASIEDFPPTQGESKAGEYVRGLDIKKKEYTEKAKDEHHKVLGEMKAMPNPKLKGLAKGGEVQYLDEGTPDGGLAATATNFFNRMASGSSGESTASASDSPPQSQDDKYKAVREQNAKNIGRAKGGEIHAEHCPCGNCPQNFDDGGGVEQSAAQQTFEPSVQPQMPSNSPPPDVAASGASFPQQQVQAYQQYEQDLKNQAQQDNENKIMGQQATQRLDDYMTKNPIDEKHLIENMGTGQKVANAIGLIAGGFTQGFTHGAVGNAAYDYLQKQIDRDISAQKDRSDQQKTIYGAYKDLFGEDNIATGLAKVSMLNRLDNKINMAAAKMNSPQAANNLGAAQKQNAVAKDQILTGVGKKISEIQKSGSPPPTSFWEKFKSHLHLPTGGNMGSAEAGTMPPQKQPVNPNKNEFGLDMEVPETDPIPQFQADMGAINASQYLGAKANPPPNQITPGEVGPVNSELAKIDATNQKIKLIHQNFAEMWKNRSDAGPIAKYFGGLGANIGGAHLSLPDLSSLSESQKNYYRAASTVENELASLVGPGGLTEQQANTIRNKYIKENDTPDDYRNVLKSIDNYIISNTQTPILGDKYNKIKRPKMSE